MTIKELINKKALFVVNNSGGKDSQAMLLLVKKLVPKELIIVIHADLSEVEFEGTLEHAKNISEGLPFFVVKSHKTFQSMVDHRQNWPSPKFRLCTSTLKTNPIEKFLRQYTKKHQLTYVVNCMGLRAAESCQRAKKIPFKFNEKNSKAGRQWFDWLPIFEMSHNDVILTIKKSGQDVHWAYKKGMSRLSCAFCIMASKGDLRVASKIMPELLDWYAAKEKEIGKTVFAKKVKGECVPIPIKEWIK